MVEPRQHQVSRGVVVRIVEGKSRAEALLNPARYSSYLLFRVRLEGGRQAAASLAEVRRLQEQLDWRAGQEGGHENTRSHSSSSFPTPPFLLPLMFEGQVS